MPQITEWLARLGSQGATGAAQAVSEIRKRLESIGLGQYAEAFVANDIDMDLLRHVDDQMLKDIGVASAGHRLRI
jgi:SAM domain (Sterile alpha motif)